MVYRQMAYRYSSDFDYNLCFSSRSLYRLHTPHARAYVRVFIFNVFYCKIIYLFFLSYYYCMLVKPLFYPHVACQPWLRPDVLDPNQVINCWREPYVPGFGLSWTGNQRYVLPPIMVRLSVKAMLAQLVCSA